MTRKEQAEAMWAEIKAALAAHEGEDPVLLIEPRSYRLFYLLDYHKHRFVFRDTVVDGTLHTWIPWGEQETWIELVRTLDLDVPWRVEERVGAATARPQSRPA